MRDERAEVRGSLTDCTKGGVGSDTPLPQREAIMRITISGARYTPKWETLQAAINQTMHPDGDKNGKIIRIQRPDGGCGYREPGIYNLDFRVEGNIVPIVLEVTQD